MTEPSSRKRTTQLRPVSPRSGERPAATDAIHLSSASRVMGTPPVNVCSAESSRTAKRSSASSSVKGSSGSRAVSIGVVSGSEPGDGLVEPLHGVLACVARHHPSEETHRVLDPVVVRDQSGPVPQRRVRHARSEPELHVLPHRARLESVEVLADHDREPDHRGGGDALHQRRREDLVIVLFRDVTGEPESENAVGQTRERLDHRAYSCGCETFTSQRTPKRSISMPNVSPHCAFSSGCSTCPPSVSLSKYPRSRASSSPLSDMLKFEPGEYSMWLGVSAAMNTMPSDSSCACMIRSSSAGSCDAANSLKVLMSSLAPNPP